MQLVECRKKGNKLYEADVLYQMAEIARDVEEYPDTHEVAALIRGEVL